MMFTGHLCLPQSYIQAVLYIYKTDYMIPLVTVHVSYAPYIFGEHYSLVEIVRKANKQMNSDLRETVNFTI